MWRRAPHPRQRCDLAKPPRQPTWLHAHFCTGSKDSYRSPPASRASLPVRPGLVWVAVAAPSGSALVAPSLLAPQQWPRGVRTVGRQLPRDRNSLGAATATQRGLRAGWPPDQRSRPAEPGRVPERRGAPWGGRGGRDIGATDLARRPVLTGRAHPSSRSRRSSRGPRAAGPSLRRSPRSRPWNRRGGARTRSRARRLHQSSLAQTRCGHRPAEPGSGEP